VTDFYDKPVVRPSTAYDDLLAAIRRMRHAAFQVHEPVPFFMHPVEYQRLLDAGYDMAGFEPYVVVRP